MRCLHRRFEPRRRNVGRYASRSVCRGRKHVESRPTGTCLGNNREAIPLEDRRAWGVTAGPHGPALITLKIFTRVHLIQGIPLPSDNKGVSLSRS